MVSIRVFPADSSRRRSRSLMPCAVIRTRVGSTGAAAVHRRATGLARIANPRALQVVEHDLVVHELPVDRSPPGIADPDRPSQGRRERRSTFPCTSARITRMTGPSCRAS